MPRHEVSLFLDESIICRTSSPNVHILHKPSEISNADNLIVVSSCNRIAKIASYISAANHRNMLRVLLLRNDDSPYWTTRFLYSAGLRSLRNLLVHSGYDIPRRIVEAWAAGVQHKLIADATVQDDSLLVLDCALKLFELPFAKIKALKTIPVNDRQNFAIDPDGNDIFWEKYDVRLDIAGIESILHPEKNSSMKLVHDKKFGHAVAAFRNLYGLRQSDILGLTERQVRRIETGEQSATLNSLNALAQAHKLPLKKYLNEVAELINE